MRGKYGDFHQPPIDPRTHICHEPFLGWKLPNWHSLTCIVGLGWLLLSLAQHYSTLCLSHTMSTVWGSLQFYCASVVNIYIYNYIYSPLCYMAILHSLPQNIILFTQISIIVHILSMILQLAIMYIIFDMYTRLALKLLNDWLTNWLTDVLNWLSNNPVNLKWKTI